MDKLKQELDYQLNIFIAKMPEKGNNSAMGMQKRLQFVIEKENDFKKVLKETRNNFLLESKENQFKEEEVEFLLKKYYEKYLKIFSTH